MEVLFPAQAEVTLSDEIERIANAVSAGKLDQRVREEIFEGRFRVRAQQLNHMLEAVDAP